MVKKTSFYLLLFICFFTNIFGQAKKQNSNIVNATTFGVKPDYKNGIGTDNTKFLQDAIDFCSKNNLTLLLPKGKILLNSYGITSADKAHVNILQLKSNLTIKGNKSELVIGSFFHDKHFIVFSGFNSIDSSKFDTLQNIKIKNITIDFNSQNSYMVSGYKLRRGIELGHTKNVTISDCKFYNGDISCCIGSGFHSKNFSSNIEISNNIFLDLTQSSQNIDHTSVYINSLNSKVHHNKFINSSIQGKLVACATEFHNSDNQFYKNTINGYTRMMFLASTKIENKEISNLIIRDNFAELTNAGIYLWVEENCKIKTILIKKNTFISEHVSGYGMIHNGTQGILADARNDVNAKIEDMTITENKTIIKKTVIGGRAVQFATEYTFKDTNNTCEGCNDGLFYKK